MHDAPRFFRRARYPRHSSLPLSANFLAIVALVLFSFVGLASFNPTAALSAEHQRPYLLDSGDTVRIKVYEWPGLDSDMVVGADGTVALPLIGNSRARGLTPDGLAALIGKRLAEQAHLSAPPSVVVSIVKYRPFFILGDVARPGEYSFQPGLTVLKAIGVAGGFYRQSTSAFERFERDSIIARSDLRTMTFRVYQKRLQIARIEAELAGQRTLKLPSQISGARQEPEIKKLIEKEQKILNANLDLLEQQIETANGLAEISKSETASLEKQVEAESRQLRIVEKEAKRLRKLRSKGLTNETRVLDVERTLIRIQGSRQALQTQIIRSRLDMHRAARRADELKRESHKRLRDEQLAAQTALKEALVAQRRSQNLVVEAEVSAPRGFKAAQENSILRTITIVRVEAGKSTELTVDELAAVRPGDVVNIERILPDANANDEGSSRQSGIGSDVSVAARGREDR